MSVVISAVICTYNRSKMLKGCLESICQQSLDKNLFEIIVVDNNSSDDTLQVVTTFSSKCNIRYYDETKQGLSFARNTGWENARGQYVAFIDDDALAEPNWLEIAIGLIESVQPPPDCLGGPIYPFYTSPKPKWFRDEYEIRRDWDKPQFLARGKSFSGSNSIWSRKTLQVIKGFDVNAGMKGNTLSLGDETSVFNQLWESKSEPCLYYSPELIVHHWVPEYKMTVVYRLKRSFALGQYHAKIFKFRVKRMKLIQILIKVSEMIRVGLRALLRVRSHPSWHNWAVEDCSRVFISVGEILGLLGFYPNLSQSSQ